MMSMTAPSAKDVIAAERRQEPTVKRFMRQIAAQHRDFTGEYDCTNIAEDAIDKFNLDDSDGAPVWDWAVEVVEMMSR